MVFLPAVMVFAMFAIWWDQTFKRDPVQLQAVAAC